MNKEKEYKIPRPIISKNEENALQQVNNRYKKLTTPGFIAKTGKKVEKVVPSKVKKMASDAKKNITEAELFSQCMKIVADGFDVLEKQAAKTAISEKSIVKKVNNVTPGNDITSIDEICLARSFNISKLVNKYRKHDLTVALVEGAATGVFGFAGLPFNIVLSTFIYYRAVQSVAMFYGYDIKNDPTELIIAGDVFMNALSPQSNGSDEVSNMITKIMVMAETSTIKQTAKKTWQDMAAKGGVCLFITRMRALANKSAQTALEKAGQKGLEKNAFKNIFEQLGKNLSKKTVGKIVPYFGAIIGGLFDTALMNTVIEYADVFYHKRFILEKEVRINLLVNDEEDIIDIDI